MVEIRDVVVGSKEEPEVFEEIVDDVDHRWAGETLDSWFGYVPEESVIIATEAAVAQVGQRFIAFTVPKELPGDFKKYVEHQRRAGRAYVAAKYPHLNVKFRTRIAAFRGVGSDVRVFYVFVGNKEDK